MPTPKCDAGIAFFVIRQQTNNYASITIVCLLFDNEVRMEMAKPLKDLEQLKHMM